jgi:hypothetical protein
MSAPRVYNVRKGRAYRRRAHRACYRGQLLVYDRERRLPLAWAHVLYAGLLVLAVLLTVVVVSR